MQEPLSIRQGSEEAEMKGTDHGNLSGFPSELRSSKDDRMPKAGRRKDSRKDRWSLHERDGDKSPI